MPLVTSTYAYNVHRVGLAGRRYRCRLGDAVCLQPGDSEYCCGSGAPDPHVHPLLSE
jgi:hypothetical protein